MGRLLVIVGVLAILAAAGGLVAAYSIVRRGLSAREAPTRMEEFLALRMRAWATPRRVRDLPNPVRATDQVLAGARHHFADHCASCHANDGSGQTEMGKNLYPKTPDLRAARTQDLTDGEIYGIIQNGIRLSGMPAWGAAHENDEETWALVAFIRRLSKLTPAELSEMERWNPVSAAERDEEQEEQNFLEGKDAGTSMPPMPGMKH